MNDVGKGRGGVASRGDEVRLGRGCARDDEDESE